MSKAKTVEFKLDPRKPFALIFREICNVMAEHGVTKLPLSATTEVGDVIHMELRLKRVVLPDGSELTP